MSSKTSTSSTHLNSLFSRICPPMSVLLCLSQIITQNIADLSEDDNNKVETSSTVSMARLVVIQMVGLERLT